MSQASLPIGGAAALAAVSILAVGARAQLPDYDPTAPEVVLNTDITTITPVAGPPFTVVGGVFVFRNVRIRNGVTVRGVGSRPMVWVVTGDFVVDGRLLVDGGDGQPVYTLQSANFPTPGGVGACGGGNGGRGSPNTTATSPTGEAGFGPLQIPGFGGQGGRVTPAGCSRGSAGGGGSYATAGDPWYVLPAGPRPPGAFPQTAGTGGSGCSGPHSGVASRSLAGGGPGRSPFVDGRVDNDFWGLAINLQSRRVIAGELPAPLGGSGGGGGGDRALAGLPFITNNKGGGGGGGGGVLIIASIGEIRVGVTGVISANGGNGGGGEQAGSNNQGGGGAGGSGGMMVLYSLGGIVLHTHGETYANRDYSFVLSADGGVGTQSAFGGTGWSGKYPPPEQWQGSGSWDASPAGGFGGLGVVELLTRPGTDADGTGTILDDNITVLDPQGQPLPAVEKVRYLAWRGFPNAAGVWVDDNNNPTYFNTNPADQGDIRPPPVLLPILQ